MRMKDILLATSLVTTFSQLAAGQEPEKKAEAAVNEQKLRTAMEDLTVPDSPALTVLGASSEEVIRPKSPRELALSFTNGAFGNDGINAGFALDTAPYLLFRQDDITLGSYNKKYSLDRHLSRTELSLATAKVGDDDADGVAAAIGFRYTPWDRGDPFWTGSEDSTVSCFRDRLTENFEALDAIYISRNNLRGLVVDDGDAEFIDEVPPLIDDFEKKEAELAQLIKDAAKDEEITKKRDEVKAAKDKLGPSFVDKLDEYKGLAKDEDLNIKQKGEIATACRKEFKDGSWNASSLTFGLAPTWTSDDGSYEDLEWSGLAAYATLAYGFEEFNSSPLLKDGSQLLFHARYRSEEIVPDEDVAGGSFEQDTLILAGQFRFALGQALLSDGAKGRDLNTLLEIGYIDANRTGADDEKFWRWAVGAEIALFGSDNTYFQVTAGSDEGDDESGDAFVLGALKFGFSSDSLAADF